MNLLVSAFKSFGEMNWTEIGKALTTAGASIGVFVLALNLAKGTLGAAVALTTMAAAVNLLVPAIKELGSLSLTEMGMALLAVAGAFTALGVAAAILAPLTPVIVALSLSISALALSIGALLALNSAAMFIGNLASSLTLLQNLNFQVFIEALKSAAWLVVEFITGIIKGLAEVASTLATSIAKIIEAVCSAVVLQEMTLGDELHTWKDLFLIPASRPIVQPPIEKTMTLDVEGMSGEADLSHGLTGYPVFNDREGSWQFYIDTDRWREANGFWGPVGSFAYRDIMRRLNRMMERPFQTKIIFDDDPLFYYVGRVWVSERPSQQYDHTKITLQYRLYPYKYLLVEDGDDWLWDTFCFETDIATVKTHDVVMKAGERETFPLVFTDKPSVVFVTSTGAATANMQNQNGVDYTLLGQESMPETQYIFLTSFSSGGTSYECRLQTLVMPLVTKEYDIHMMGMELALYPVSTGKVTVSIRKKGTSVLLASDSFTVTRTSSGTGVEYQIFDGIGLMADLEKNTAYEIVVEAAGKAYAPNVPKESLTGNDYLDFGTGAQAIAADSGGYELFCGSVSFYAGEGAVLKPGVKTNIGIVGTAPDNNGRVVVVQAEEDTSISIDYRPAYL